MSRRLLIWSFASFFALAPVAGELACLLGLHPCCLEGHSGGRGRAAGDQGESRGDGEPRGRSAAATDGHARGHHAHHGDATERAGRDWVGGASHQDAPDGSHGSEAADCRTHCDGGGRVAARGRLPRPLAVESQRISAAVPSPDSAPVLEHVPLRA
jgi:hypothetical protein